VGHVVASEPTSTGRCGLKLQLIWQHVDARRAPYLDLELVCRVLGLQGIDSRGILLFMFEFLLLQVIIPAEHICRFYPSGDMFGIRSHICCPDLSYSQSGMPPMFSGPA
jgi:hypothetical protein